MTVVVETVKSDKPDAGMMAPVEIPEVKVVVRPMKKTFVKDSGSEDIKDEDVAEDKSTVDSFGNSTDDSKFRRFSDSIASSSSSGIIAQDVTPRPAGSKKTGKQKRSSSPAVKNSNVFVGNLPSAMDEAQLRYLFLSFGKIASVKIMRPSEEDLQIAATTQKPYRNCGFVLFLNHASASQAIKEYDGVVVSGHELRVRWAKPFRKQITQPFAFHAMETMVPPYACLVPYGMYHPPMNENMPAAVPTDMMTVMPSVPSMETHFGAIQGEIPYQSYYPYKDDYAPCHFGPVFLPGKRGFMPGPMNIITPFGSPVYTYPQAC